MLLALDTATRHTGLALFDGRQITAELNWHSADGQTSELSPRLVQLLDWQGLAAGDLSAVAVSLGPGSFTGLRVALSLAKGLAAAHGLPLLGVPTLDATVYPFLHGYGTVCGLVQAGRGRICWAVYYGDGQAAPDRALPADVGDWSGRRTPYVQGTVAEMLAQFEQPARFAGELTPQNRHAIAAAMGDRAHLPAPGSLPRRAGDLALLGWHRWQAGPVDDAATLSPIYLREP